MYKKLINDIYDAVTNSGIEISVIIVKPNPNYNNSLIINIETINQNISLTSERLPNIPNKLDE